MGTVLACIPPTFIVGVVVLIAAFAVSLIGVFKKNAAKWPSIVGMILAIVGGATGSVVALVVAASLAGPIADPSSTGIPTPSTSEQPTASSTSGTDDGRPSAETIADLLGQNARDGGITGHEGMPDSWPCMGRELYASDVSDESLWLVIQGSDPLEPEREIATVAIEQAVDTCDPYGQGAWG